MSAPTGQELREKLAGFDVDGALERLGNMESLYVEVLESFCDEQAGAVDVAAALVDSSDLEGAAREIHTLKGLAGTIGATELEATSAELEAGLRANRPRAELDGLLAACRGTVEAAIERARQVI